MLQTVLMDKMARIATGKPKKAKKKMKPKKAEEAMEREGWSTLLKSKKPPRRSIERPQKHRLRVVRRCRVILQHSEGATFACGENTRQALSQDLRLVLDRVRGCSRRSHPTIAQVARGLAQVARMTISSLRRALALQLTGEPRKRESRSVL